MAVLGRIIRRNRRQYQKFAELHDLLLPMFMNEQVTVGEAEKELGMVAEEGAIYQKKKLFK
tara:strand:- start:1385 stop:1567 length:183 start_codon:yes stop_codon:yes gene_type:complete